jgi:hypothetical protein
MKDLKTLSGDVQSSASSINPGPGGRHCSGCEVPWPAVFVEKGVMTDLNTLIRKKSSLHLITACSINSRGEIAGLARTSKGEFHSTGPFRPKANKDCERQQNSDQCSFDGSTGFLSGRKAAILMKARKTFEANRNLSADPMRRLGIVSVGMGPLGQFHLHRQNHGESYPSCTNDGSGNVICAAMASKRHLPFLLDWPADGVKPGPTLSTSIPTRIHEN